MAQLDVRRLYADGDILLQADLDAFLDDLETFLNLTKLNDDNLQDGGITASSKLVNASITLAKMGANSVGTTQLVDLGVTTAKLNDLAVTTGKLADLAVTTGKLADLAVTNAKIAAATIQISKIDVTSVSIGALTRKASYIAAGASTFTTPAGVTSLLLRACGGGGGGGSTFGGTIGTGGAGAIAQWYRISGLTASTLYNLSIGAGGAGGIHNTSVATSGGNTSFNSVVVAKGAPGAQYLATTATMSSLVIPSGYSLGGTSNQGSNTGTAGQASPQFDGGAKATFTTNDAGGGGASSDGPGGAGAIPGAAQAGQGAGAGGGASIGADGGAGADGRLDIFY